MKIDEKIWKRANNIVFTIANQTDGMSTYFVEAASWPDDINHKDGCDGSIIDFKNACACCWRYPSAASL